MKYGLAGRLAAAWINSKLTPLVIVASLLIGAFSVYMLPREEEPQIIVPMIDVIVGMPGASSREVEERVTRPMEKLLWEIPGVEYLYSTSSPGSALVIVRFKVGEDEERSIVKLNQKMHANEDRIPIGATRPLIKPRSIDDVPILALTLHSRRYNDTQLRSVAGQLQDAITQVAGVSEVRILGGQRRELKVTIDSQRLAGYNLSPLQVLGAMSAANRRLPAGQINRDNREILVETGDYLRTTAEVKNTVVGAPGGRPVYVRDVAEVADTAEEPVQIVQFARNGQFEPAVTISVAKRKGKNAIIVAQNVLHRVEALKGTLIPSDIETSITRNYGETAAEKSNELLSHMGIAVVSVSLLIAFVLGFRGSLIVFTAIPVTLALTLTVFYVYGYTLNRITLFALIFSIGILVDDAIVVVENIVRHTRLPGQQGKPISRIAVEAVDEVGNPTILATLTVVAAILPMAFVGGLSGPYMRPIPIVSTAAMIFSLLVAFIVTPWAAIRLLKHKGHSHGEGAGDFFTRLYRRTMGPLLSQPVLRSGFLLLVTVLLLGSMSLVYIEFVKLKMLPFDNKSEFQVIIDLPEGTPLEQTAHVARALAAEVFHQPEVTDAQTYVGTASPYNFNGLVRHYFMRNQSNMADIQVNLLPKDERGMKSHEIAKQVRERLEPVARKFGARIKVAEVPPGPPVLQPLVAEVYGPDAAGRERLARQVLDIMDHTPGVVDADWYVEDSQPKERWVIDRQKAALNGLTVEQIAATLRAVSAGEKAGLLHDDAAKEDVPIVLRLDRATRSDRGRLESLRIPTPGGALVPLSEVTRVETVNADKSIYHKNLMQVTYVTADVAGIMESPVYAILALGPKIGKLEMPGGYHIEQYMAHQPFDDQKFAMKWDGEWHITYEVFRDLGLAFAAVLVLIYVLVVGWFQSFTTPLVIMAAIPFSLVGILPAHGLLNAFFTATSMVGFIAGAGIVVRNSIILVDFIELRMKEGMPLKEAVIEAGAVRFRPMLLTAAAVVAGSSVMLFDPIFQGLAIAMVAGEIASLLLSRVTVPILYYVFTQETCHESKPGVAKDGLTKVAAFMRKPGEQSSGFCG